MEKAHAFAENGPLSYQVGYFTVNNTLFGISRDKDKACPVAACYAS